MNRTPPPEPAMRPARRPGNWQRLDVKDGQVMVVLSGPFAGRRYLRDSDGKPGPRVRPDATRQQLQDAIAGARAALGQEETK